jgi:hypothetical protein
MLPMVIANFADKMVIQLTYGNKNFIAITAERRAILKLPARQTRVVRATSTITSLRITGITTAMVQLRKLKARSITSANR